MAQERLIIGVDVGLTGTGVAYSLWSPQMPSSSCHTSVQNIQCWPDERGNHFKQVENKVPTRLAYRAAKKTKKWGFQCPLSGLPKYNTVKYFKLWLEPDMLELAPPEIRDEYSSADVKGWFADFLERLYEWIGIYFRSQKEGDYYKHIKEGRVEYLFSVPTTWKDLQVVNDFKEAIARAGFHPARVDLTEAEAAAVSTLVEVNSTLPSGVKDDAYRYKVGDRLIVCDAGGGTTDTTVLTISSLDDGVFVMEQEGEVKGEAIGSVQIDEEIEQLISSRLDMLPGHRRLDPKVMDIFRDIKHKIGELDSNHLPAVELQLLDSCPVDTTMPQASIEKGRLKLKIAEVEKAFDTQIKRIIELIDGQLWSGSGSRNKIHYLALSGGLGSSEYVQKSIRRYYGTSLKLMISQEPQLAVCNGLVINRMQRLSAGKSMINRCSRASYGVLYNEIFSPDKHSGQQPVKNPYDGKKYAHNQIKWLIEQGKPVDEFRPVVQNYRRSIPYKTTKEAWTETVVSYIGDPAALPKYWSPEPRNQIPTLKLVKTFDFQWKPLFEEVAKMKTKRKSLWKFSSKYKYWVMEYELRVHILPADLSFELWHGKRKLGTTGTAQDDKIEVDWEPQPPAGAEWGGSVRSLGSEATFAVG